MVINLCKVSKYGFQEHQVHVEYRDYRQDERRSFETIGEAQAWMDELRRADEASRPERFARYRADADAAAAGYARAA